MQDCFESTDWEVFEHEDLSSTNGAVGDSTRLCITHSVDSWADYWFLNWFYTNCCSIVRVLLSALSALSEELKQIGSSSWGLNRAGLIVR